MSSISGLRAENPPATVKVVGWGIWLKKFNNNTTRVMRIKSLSMNAVEAPQKVQKRESWISGSNEFARQVMASVVGSVAFSGWKLLTPQIKFCAVLNVAASATLQLM